MEYYAFDPGETTGWARFEDGRLTDFGYEKFEDFHNFLLTLAPDLYVVEDYIIRPYTVQKGYSHQWNKGHTLRVIGAIELHGTILDIKVVKQQPSIKSAMAAQSGLNTKLSSKFRHSVDAILHGMYYAQKQLGVNPNLERLRGSQTSS